MLGICADVTDRRQAEQERARLLQDEQLARAKAEAAEAEAEAARRRATFLARASAVLASSLDYETTLQQVARLAVPDVADGCAVDLFTDDGSVQRVAVAARDPAGEALGWELWRRYPHRADHPVQRGIRGGRPFLAGEITEGALRAVAHDERHLELLRQAELRSAVTVPLHARGRILGAIVFVLTSASDRRYTAADLPFAEELARLAAIAIDNARLYRQAEAASRAKDEFLAMLAHELRTPLAAITSAMAILDRVPTDADPAVRSRAIVRRQTEHLGRLMDDLLDVARVTMGKIVLARRPVDLADTVERCVALLASAGRLQQHQLEVRVEPVWVDGDPVRLEQIVLNLVGNALKYTPAGGTVRVAAAAEDESAVLRVADTGIGIAAELLPRIFDLFTQGDRGLERSQGGLGIGLTLVKRLVEQHGGRVEARSAGAGHGAEFTVRLRRIEAAPGGEAVAVAPGAPMVPRRVLVVEDHADAREALRTMLEVAGHEVYEAEAGVAGVDAALRVRPDVAIVDIGLPGMDGYAVARRLRADADWPMRLIALSGYGQAEDRQRSADAGFDAHIVKPVDPDVLLRIIAGSG
jgi:signal transduction histidine kinase/CheY-like chemotaxis protein